MIPAKRVPRRLDHLVYAAPDLQAGVDRAEGRLGVRFLPGGSHPAWGTRNVVLPIGPTAYLEVIGPDPERPTDAVPTLFGIATLPEPRLVTWAAKGTDLGRLTERARLHGVDLGAPISGSRRLPDGTMLTWELTDPLKPRAGGLLPFFIDWPGRDHPAALAPAEIELLDVRSEHPDPGQVAAQLRVLGLQLQITAGAVPALFATFRTASGTVILA